ncbi:MAG: hypothetical protein KDG51_08140, partial [Calditrichaeota bacterium]|nr:hypothetical protein [Calditrichota bacterium]
IAVNRFLARIFRDNACQVRAQIHAEQFCHELPSVFPLSYHVKDCLRMTELTRGVMLFLIRYGFAWGKVHGAWRRFLPLVLSPGL